MIAVSYTHLDVYKRQQYDGAKIQQTEKTYEEYKKLWKQINELYAKSEDFDSVDAKIQVWNEICLLYTSRCV